MSDAKDPAIKLFGKTIPLPEAPAPPPPPPDLAVEEGLDQDRPSSPNSLPENENSSSSRAGEDQVTDKPLSGGSPNDGKPEDGARAPPITAEESADPNDTTVENGNKMTESADNEAAATSEPPKTEEEQSETKNSQEKSTLKKPDKILPCPRCTSMDTKFCYYNNYNVNQPRHFCKNCQRYWTAGGTMRNVPVGAGRRKSKSSASHYRQTTVPDTLQTARPDLPNGVHHPNLKPNGMVLTFGSDTPLCESMASVLNIAEKTMINCARNGFHMPEELRIPVPFQGEENGDDPSSGSSASAANSKDDSGKTGQQDPVMQNCHAFPPQIPCFPGAPWPYPWNSAQWNSPIPPPPFCPPGFPMPFYPPPPYWGCTVPGPWNVSWVTPPSSTPPNHVASGPNSPTLGKHSRDENVAKQTNTGEGQPRRENNPERCLWIPKTLRIDDPEEAARSSIWATLGIKNEKADSSSGGLFKAFQSKGDEKNHVSDASPVLQANPAALSRSLNFHESS